MSDIFRGILRPYFFLVKEDILMTQKCFTAVSTNYLAHVKRRQKHHNLDTTRIREYIYATRENNYGRENYCDGKMFIYIIFKLHFITESQNFSFLVFLRK